MVSKIKSRPGFNLKKYTQIQWDKAVALWNSGKNLNEISIHTGIKRNTLATAFASHRFVGKLMREDEIIQLRSGLFSYAGNNSDNSSKDSDSQSYNTSYTTNFPEDDQESSKDVDIEGLLGSARISSIKLLKAAAEGKKVGASNLGAAKILAQQLHEFSSKQNKESSEYKTMSNRELCEHILSTCLELIGFDESEKLLKTLYFSDKTDGIPPSPSPMPSHATLSSSVEALQSAAETPLQFFDSGPLASPSVEIVDSVHNEILSPSVESSEVSYGETISSNQTNHFDTKPTPPPVEPTLIGVENDFDKDGF